MCLALAVVLSLHTMAGCIVLPTPPSADPNNPATYWIELRADQDPESIWWNFTILMHVNETFQFESWGSQGAPWNMQLTGGPEKRSVPLYPYEPEEDSGFDSQSTLRMDAGTHRWTRSWNGHDDENPYEVPHNGEPVEPGSYQVTAEREEIDVHWRTSAHIEIR